MKKFILLVSAWLGFAATAIVHAQVESTQYAFTWKSTPDDNNPDDKTEIALPARFTMQGWASLVVYDDPEGFVLNDETKMLNIDWAEFPNGDARLSISYTAKYMGESGETVTISKDNWQEWVPQWENANKFQYDLTTFSNNNSAEGSMWVIKQLDPNAEFTIRKIKIDNYNEAGGAVIEYGLNSLNIAGEKVTVLPAKQENAKFYTGVFTVGKQGRQACNVSRFEIPEEYKGGYFRIDFGEEPANVWNLNLALKDAEESDVNSGVGDIDDYAKKIGLTRYYKIPEEAVTINPQLWKGQDDAEPWTVNVAGFYLTNGIENSVVYTDKFFPLEEDKITPRYNADKCAFDTDTKELTLSAGATIATWVYKDTINDHNQTINAIFDGPQDFSPYDYMVVVLNEPSHDGAAVMLFKGEKFWDISSRTINIPDGVFYTEIKLADWKIDGSTEYLSEMYEVGFRTDKGGTYKLSHVFLTNTLPDWENPDTRTTTAGNYGTVCFAYPAVVSGAYVYTVEGKDAAGKTLYLKPYNGVLTPGVPYLYKSIGNEEGVNFYQIKDAGSYTEATAVNGLVGCLDETVGADAGGHALHSDNTWYKIDTDVQFVNRAYLKVADVPVMTEEEAVSANVNRMVLGDWETTGIDEVKASSAQVDDEAVYNLSGIKMDADNLPKGIYIRGGKKFIVK